MIELHITVELQPSPQLMQLLQELPQLRSSAPRKPSREEIEVDISKALDNWAEQLEKKPQEAQEEPKQPDPDLYLLEEIPQFPAKNKDFIDLPINSAMQYYELGDCLCIRYYANRIYTTWTSAKKLYARFGDLTRQRALGPLLREGDKGNRRQTISYFLRAMNAGLKPGQAAGSKEDPDDDFRSFTKSVVDTSTRVDGGKLETLEG